MRLTGNEQIVAFNLDFNSQASEGIGDDSQVPNSHIFDSHTIAYHGCHADERPHLNHVW